MGIRPARVIGAEHGIHTGHGLLHRIRLRHIGLHHGEILLCRNFFRMPRQRHHFMSTRKQFLQHRSTDKTRGTNQSDFHFFILFSIGWLQRAISVV